MTIKFVLMLAFVLYMVFVPVLEAIAYRYIRRHPICIPATINPSVSETNPRKDLNPGVPPPFHSPGTIFNPPRNLQIWA